MDDLSKAPVKSKHADYKASEKLWEKCRDVVAGQDVIHAKAIAYLPMLKDEPLPSYTARKNRTVFFNATNRTVDGLKGMMFRKPPIVKVAASVEPLLLDVTLDDTPLHLFALEIVDETLTVGRVGILVDYPIANTPGLTQADALLLNLRPKLCMYKAESILNWKTKAINNVSMLSFLVLKECYTEYATEFSTDGDKDQYRVLDLVDVIKPDGGVSVAYRVRIFRIAEDGTQFQQGEDAFPLMGAKTLDFIPFQFIGVDNVTANVCKPPLMDLVNMNLAHYGVTADYEHACHFTALPTPYICGWVPAVSENGDAKQDMFIGSTTAWLFPDPATKVGFLEFTGSGIQALVDNIAGKEKQMAILGARMLEAQRKGVESAESARIHRAGEDSMLASAAQAVSLGMQSVLQIFSNWAGSTDKAEFDLNRDFFPQSLDPAMIMTLFKIMQGGGMSWETYFENMQRYEIFDGDDTAEDELTKITETEPALLGAELPLVPLEAGSAPGQPAGSSDPNLIKAA